MLMAGTISAGLGLFGEAGSSKTENPINASITVDPEPLHTLTSTQYGHFIEHIGGVIKGGIWAEGETADMFIGGVRRELIAAIKSLNPALIRYPGGCFADGYHWKDGIGPRTERPIRKNRAWAKLGPRIGPLEDNRFGTDEFIKLCEAVGASPQLTANVGSGSAQEAADWVEYCNGPADSKWGRERARNGRPAPYKVKHWYIGNEIFGIYEIGHQKPHVYVNTVKEYARAMRKVDPDIKLIACGNLFPGKTGKDINRIVLTGAGEEIDYLSVHHYVPFFFTPANFLRYQIAHLQGSKSRRIYYDVLGTVQIMREFLEKSVRELRAYSPVGRKIHLCFDEWNLWFSFLSDLSYSNFNLRDGLWVATMFNLLHRLAPDIPMANIAQMVNCCGVITSTKKGTFLTPSALVHRIYTEHAQENLLPSSITCPPIPHVTELPVLDISATRSENKLVLFMVNRHYDADVAVSCNLKGLKIEPVASRIEMSHPNPVQYNTFDKPDEVQIKETAESISISDEGTGSRIMLRLKPHSLTCFEFKIIRA